MNRFLPFSRTTPSGYLKKYMEVDLSGFVGHLDELIPSLIIEDRIYGADRRTNLNCGSNSLDLGVLVPDEAASNQYRWWNCETQGNWLDGFVRSAILLQDEAMLAKAKFYVEYYLASQDKDGYLGIYQEDLRFQTGIENGELWSQSVLLRALFAYYEYSASELVFLKIRAAADRIMIAFPANSEARPFSNSKEPEHSFCTGIGHGLTIVDIFFWLYKTTDEIYYREYCVWLYKQFNLESGTNLDADVMIRNILDSDYRMTSHSVHTYEQVRALALAAFFGQSEEYRTALDSYWNYVTGFLTCPSGAAIGDECISPTGADATSTGYEYCGLQELLHSYSLMLELTSAPVWAERIERLLFNAAMGAHLQNESAVTYCQTDNCYALSGKFQLNQPHCRTTDENQSRYKYSPTHQDVAVCCVPNAGRILPYYLMAMYALKDDVLTKYLFGPSDLNTAIKGSRIHIEEKSNYPFQTNISLNITVMDETVFTFRMRIPEWVSCFDLTGIEYKVLDGFIVISSVWHDTTEIKLRFHRIPSVKSARNGDAYINLGGLTMALKIPAQAKTVRTYPLEGFSDRHYTAISDDYQLRLCAEKPLLEVPDGVQAWFINEATNQLEQRLLVPMGKTTLRRVTFPKE